MCMGHHVEQPSRCAALLGASSVSQAFGARFLLPAFLVAIVLAAMGAHLSWQNMEAAQLKQRVQALQHEVVQLHKQSAAGHKATQQELEASKQAVLQGLASHTANWVREQQLSHVGLVGSGCSSQGNTSGLILRKTQQLVAPIVILAYNRTPYLARAMVSLLRHWGSDPANTQKFPLYISIDGDHQPTTLLALALNFTSGVQVIRNVRSAQHCAPVNGHCNLAMHYLMLVQLFFECLAAPRLIFLEEDLEVAPDFLSYFQATAPLLDADPSLLCVSAWNDHGQAGRASNATALYRTDVMPGLGWMLGASVARELLPGWLNATRYGGWDEYLRAPCVRRGRQCVFPEVARSHTFGRVGNSGGMFYDNHLHNMVLNSAPMNWSSMDLSYLRNDSYAARMRGWLAAAAPLDANATQHLAALCSPAQQPRAGVGAFPAESGATGDLLLRYDGHEQYRHYARQLAPMLGDISVGGGIPRASYNGTVIVRCRGRRLFLTPQTPAQPAKC